jgi:hydrophobic/amphiphilic exporter-1 (mainly G- bacteria), HAE1 family
MTTEFEPVKTNPAIRFMISRYVLAIGVFLAIVLFGLVAIPNLGLNLYPTLSIPTLAVTTTYSGGTPLDMDRRVSKVIEDNISTLAGVTDISSTSGAGFSQIIINFRNGTNIDSAANELAGRISSLRGDLPSAANAPVIEKFDLAAVPVLQVAVSSPKGLQAAREWADKNLKPVLERVQGVSAVQVLGAPKREVQVQLEPNKLSEYGISSSEVTSAIQNQSLELPAGNLNANGRRVGITTRNIPVTVQDIEAIQVDSSRGLRVLDIASVRDSESKLEAFTRVNGNSVVLLNIRKTSIANTVGVVRGAREALAGVILPSGFQLITVGDTASYIQHSVEDTVKEGVLVAIAVAVICLLALGKVNTAFAVILAIPISLAAAPLLFQIMGFSLNIITLLALIVAMGIVVDDSIVVAENVERYIHMGHSRLEAVLRGASEIFSAVSAATWSLLAVLLPISFLPGIVGQFFREFALGLAAAIFFSWLEAIFFLTVRMVYTPDPEPKSWKQSFKSFLEVRVSTNWTISFLRNWLAWLGAVALAVGLYSINPWLTFAVLLYPILIWLARHLLLFLFNIFTSLVNALFVTTNGLLEKLRAGYERSLRVALRFSPVVLLIALLFLGSGMIAFSQVPFTFQSASDNSAATIQLNLPAGSNLETSNVLTRRLERFAQQQPEIKNIITTVNNDNATLSLELKPLDERPSVFVLVETWRKLIKTLFRTNPEAEIRVLAGDESSTGTSTTIVLNAPSQELLEQRHNAVLQAIRNDPRVASARSSLGDSAPERVFIPDPIQLERTGLSANDVANYLREALEGNRAGDMRDQSGESIPIRVALRSESLSDTQALLGLPMFASSLNSSLPIGELGRFELREAPTTINRNNKAYSARINVNFKSNSSAASTFTTEIESKLKTQKILDDRVRFSNGESGSDAALTGDLVKFAPIAIGLALILNYLVLGAQFNSFRYPIYLLTPVPLAIVGGVWALVVFGVGFDVIGVLGMVVLIGLSTKNAILLLDFVVERAKTMTLSEALISSGGLRLRPILMTTLTVLVISIPLIIGGGEGSELRKGLGIIILGGLLTTTVLTLYVVPALFSIMEGKRFRQQKPQISSSIQTVST